MRRLTLFCVIIILLGLFACDKKDSLYNAALPNWLDQKIGQMELDQDMCKLTNIITISFNSQLYYVIQTAVSSCMYCDIYDEHGIKPQWDDNTYVEFHKNCKILKTQNAC